MRLLVAGGGSAGHINPALAVAKYARAHGCAGNIWFVGAFGGLEERLVPREGFKLYTYELRGFSRKLRPADIIKNVQTFFLLKKANREARRILRETRPDVVFATGGFASYPIVRAAAAMGIKTALHESNALPGLTTRALASKVDCIMFNFPASLNYFKGKKTGRLIVTGNPVREDMLFVDKAEAKRELGLSGKKVVAAIWGSLGASNMNKITAELIKKLAESEIHFICATGQKGYEKSLERLRELSVDLQKTQNIEVRPYIDNMPQVMAAADLMLCRAGAMTVSELCVTGTPAILIPSPYVAENHQEKNAREIERYGGAKVITEAECQADTLYQEIVSLLNKPDELEKMKHAMKGMAVFDGLQKIFKELENLTL